MNIALPIEIKVREYYSKVLLAYQIIKNTNHQVIIGEKNKIYSIYKNNKDVLLISKGGPEKNLFIKKKIYNNKFLILDEEGPVLNFQNFVIENRVTKKIFEIIDDYIYWGKRDFEIIRKKLRQKLNQKTIFGHPKFDLCKKPFIDFYKKEIDELKKRYKKFVFFSSSFGSDQILDDKIYQEFIYKNLQNENLRNKKIIKNERIIENKNYESVVQLLKQLAKSNPNINFIFRPHPRQDIKKVKKRFSGIRNIFVIYKYSVTPWIKACEIFMHSGCTTVFEAISMKKKIVSFCEYKNQYRNNFSFKFGYHFSNHKDVENKIKKILSISYSKNHQLAKNYIKNTSKDNFFYKDFINYLKTIRNSNNSSHLTYQKFSNNNFKNYLVKVKSFVFRSKIIKFTYFIFNKNFLLSREYKKKKIESIKKTEIINDLNKINKIAGIKVFFKIKKLDDNLFQISKK